MFARVLLLILPLLSVTVVIFALFVVGVPRAYLAARIYGGPTDSSEMLAVRVELVSRSEEREQPEASRPIRVTLGSAGQPLAVWQGETDRLGIAEARLALKAIAKGPLDVEVTSNARPAARGAMFLAREQWLKGVQHRGGFLRASASKGNVRIRVAPARGVFAVPFAEELWIQLGSPPSAAAATPLSVLLEGASPKQAQLTSDERGFARLLVTPSEHNASVVVKVDAKDAELSQTSAELPIVPGAMRALRDGKELRIEAPIEREHAFFALVNESGRLGGGRASLTPDGRGGAVANVGHPALATKPLYAVISSEIDHRSQAAVGWPLDLELGSEPARTFDVAETLLLDGTKQGQESERARLSKVRLLTAAFVVLALGLSVVLLFVRVRTAERDIAAHLTEGGLDPEARKKIAPARGLWLIASLLAIALGFIVIALIAIYRI